MNTDSKNQVKVFSLRQNTQVA